jgi:hypothetical protein
MRFDQPKLVTEQSPLGLRFFYLFAFLLALTLVPMTAQAERGRHKLSADLADFPVNADGTVSVIIQFNQTPRAQHFADMAARGGKLKFSLDRMPGCRTTRMLPTLARTE